MLEVPGHTLGHIAYVAAEHGWLFCGDTLFAGGCGRLFEGTPKQMLSSLDKLAAMPDDTKVYCAHEYTISNLRFALAAEPNQYRPDHARFKLEQAKREGKIYRQSHPILDWKNRRIRSCVHARRQPLPNQLIAEGRAKNNDPVAVFAALREWKNNFR